MTRVLFRDLRPAGVCPQVRTVFFKQYGLSWHQFLKEGIDSEDLLKLGSKRNEIERVIQCAIEREEREAASGRGQ